MALTDNDELKRAIEQAMREREAQMGASAHDHLRMLEDYKRRAIERQLESMQMHHIQPMIIKPAPEPPHIMAGQGRRLRLAPHSTEITDMGRVIPLPSITVSTDLVRRMRQRLGLANFLFNGEFNVQSRFELRWRKHRDPS